LCAAALPPWSQGPPDLKGPQKLPKKPILPASFGKDPRICQCPFSKQMDQTSTKESPNPKSVWILISAIDLLASEEFFYE